MFVFLKEIGDAAKSGKRAGRVVNLLQRVVGRPLSSAERGKLCAPGGWP